MKIFGAGAPRGSHFPRGRGGAGRGVHPCLAGPLHGLASQEVLTFLDKMLEMVGKEPSDAQVEGYIEELLAKGRVVPGCGHAVLRRTDPRFTCQQQFGLKHMPEDLTFKAAGQLYKIAPQVNSAH